MAELLFWPAVLAYGQAAFAYAGSLRDVPISQAVAASSALRWTVRY